MKVGPYLFQVEAEFLAHQGLTVVKLERLAPGGSGDPLFATLKRQYGHPLVDVNKFAWQHSYWETPAQLVVFRNDGGMVGLEIQLCSPALPPDGSPCKNTEGSFRSELAN